MAFLEQFSSYFNDLEKQTELYALWSSIGVNMEKAFLEEQNKINAEFTDISSFSEDTLRSWLAYFLVKIPYRTTATSQVTVSIANDNVQRTIINKYDQLRSTTGSIYTLWESMSIVPGDTRTVTAIQGKRVTETGTYNSIIKFHAYNPDLSYIEVKLNGQVIPEVSYETSYDQTMYKGSWKPQNEEGKEFGGTPCLEDGYARRGEFYTVIADGSCKFSDAGSYQQFHTGDIVIYDNENWRLYNRTNSLSPKDFSSSYAYPRDGYFAYYFNGSLYIKIFQGLTISDPTGQAYEVSYIQSDGVQGEIPENSLKFISTYQDIDENLVILDVKNTASTPAVNEPSTGKLSGYLKKRFYSPISISSIPEYTAWFKGQPEVGDCLVLSDYEKYIRSGKTKLDITGIVTIYLVDSNGNALHPDVQEALLERIEPYKDLAVLQIREFQEVKNHLAFEYTSSNNDLAFERFIHSTASQYYSLSASQSKNTSLFSSLDLTAVIKDIVTNSNYSSIGLTVRGYHYYQVSMNDIIKSATLDCYSDEDTGAGFYTFEGTNMDDEAVTYNFVEQEVIGTDSGTIYDIENRRSVGYHSESGMYIDLSEYPIKQGILKCYWAMKNKGLLSIGVDNGLRKLNSISITKMEQTNG